MLVIVLIIYFNFIPSVEKGRIFLWKEHSKSRVIWLCLCFLLDEIYWCFTVYFVCADVIFLTKQWISMLEALANIYNRRSWSCCSWMCVICRLKFSFWSYNLKSFRFNLSTLFMIFPSLPNFTALLFACWNIWFHSHSFRDQFFIFLEMTFF